MLFTKVKRINNLISVRDGNNNLHEPTNVFTVDHNGHRMYPRSLKKKKKFEQVRKTPSRVDLERLEDAIFNHEIYRNQFLKLIGMNTDIEVYVKDHIPRRLKALLECWEVWNWRPSLSGRRVMKKTKKNPYFK